MKNLQYIIYNLITNQNSSYTRYRSDNNSLFNVNDDDYNMSLSLEHGANYEVLINSLGRKREDWENTNNPRCLTHDFDEDNIYYHYLYKLNYPIILIEENDSSSFQIDINFANEEYGNKYKDSFNILDCDSELSNNIASCKFKNTVTSPGIQTFNLTNLTII